MYPVVAATLATLEPDLENPVSQDPLDLSTRRVLMADAVDESSPTHGLSRALLRRNYPSLLLWERDGKTIIHRKEQSA